MTFTVGGRTYEVDLSEENVREFVSIMSPYVEAGRVLRRRVRRAPANGVSDRTVREWAKANRVKVNARGRIPDSVRQKYVRANGAS